MASWILFLAVRRGRTVLIVLVLIGLLGGGLYAAWIALKPRIVASREYLIGPEQVEITSPPPWITRSDVRAEVFRNPTIDGRLSLLDDDLVERIENAFARHPWVAQVKRVQKEYGTVKVDLVYRKPVCMIAVHEGLLPVDAEGTLLPLVDFTPVESTRFPCLLGVEQRPTVLPGSRWTDPRVIGAAEIAAAFGESWTPMRLQYIEPLSSDPSRPAEGESNRLSGEPFFVLTTQTKTRILWRYAPAQTSWAKFRPPRKLPCSRDISTATKHSMVRKARGRWTSARCHEFDRSR